MPSKAPSNADIITAISVLSRDVGVIQAENETRHEENSKRLDAIETQVKYTNGQVRSLNQWKGEVEAVEKYKKEALPSSTPKEGIDVQKVLMYTLGLVGTALAIIGTVVSK